MRIRFNISIISAILLIISAMTLATVVSVWVVSSRTAEITADQMFESTSSLAEARLDRLIGNALELANLGATQDTITADLGNGLDAAPLSLLISALTQTPSLYSLYYGYSDGRFLQVISAAGENAVLAAHKAPSATRWIVRTISAATGEGASSDRIQSWTFLDANLATLGERKEPSPSYDPRKRPWYISALDQDEVQLSAPYLFSSLQQPGISASRRLADRGGVFGVDVTLTQLSHFVSQLKISDHGGIVMSDEAGRVIAMSQNFGIHPPLTSLKDVDTVLARGVAQAREGQLGDGTHFVDQDGRKLLVHQMEWNMGMRRIDITVAAPMDDFVSHIFAMQKQIFFMALLGLSLFVTIALFFANRMSRSVVYLAQDAERIRQCDFTGEPPRPSRIIEFHELGKAFSNMKTDLSAYTHALEVSENKLNRLVSLGIAMAAEHNGEKLMEMLLLGAKELANADGGSLYILGDDKQLHFQLVRNDSLGLAYGGTSQTAVNMPPVAMYDGEGLPNHKNVVSYCVHKGEVVNTPDAYDHVTFDFSGTRAFDEKNNYVSRSFITVPLRPRGGDVIGALQLINAREPGSDVPIAFSPEIQNFVEALSAQAATAMYNRNLLEAQEKLMDSMIQLIAGAIDAKSPYTGGHCARVPELAIMLAEEASKVDQGPLADFRFETDDQWREFRIGAWLHDSGKVITPEYVVDKATKLESIYNRIHEVRTRFEVLLRDATIERLEALADGMEQHVADTAFAQRKAQLVDDFAFIAECNVGGEFMKPESIERLKVLADIPWQRNFDDGLGLSYDEMTRYRASGPSQTLPVTEKLLDDKVTHIIEREGTVHKMYEGMNFKLDVPQYLYNHGELYNLCIERGTLTGEERFKITEHIMQTIAMLERLPFPKHLARVPEYAGTHHENMDGSGYPRQLTKDQLSVPSRIMAIADIFEALTASDRPYKKPKTLSEAVKILSFFKKDGHIDPDLFDLFLTSGGYMRYAERFLDAERIDEVDISAYVGA
ncbi:HD domain-containing phosphohydrolase [Magnetovibrio blakemorei]|uniref:Chemotaxis protein n=1 Tax=Magnetovibrio blakemorei TaxID=28181 RepID=A0A1E5Q532_9PROT|nr:HD domain-containing phosphohydrolase [Magnetovibrio blakemorei]OEJ65374.1 chemotaxis protein [Magnetovibrio blakemorei]